MNIIGLDGLEAHSNVPRFIRSVKALRLYPTSFRNSVAIGLDGLEPSTSRLSGARSNHLSYRPLFSTLAVNGSSIVFPPSFDGFGGDDGIRTHDPLLAGQVLSQLSYTPKGL